MINKPTHISGAYSSCIDLILISQPNLVVESGVHPSLHSNCHHQIIFPIDWKKAFENTSVYEKVATFNKNILNILHNFIPHETLLADGKDSPWLTSKIKNLINEKHTVFKHFYRNSNNLQILNKLESLQNLLTKSIAESKRNYYSRMADKLHITQKSSKAYWPLLKRFLNNKKILLIPSIFHDNEFLTDFKKKLNFSIHSLQNNNVLWSIITANSQQILLMWLQNA